MDRNPGQIEEEVKETKLTLTEEQMIAFHNSWKADEIKEPDEDMVVLEKILASEDPVKTAKIFVDSGNIDTEEKQHDLPKVESEKKPKVIQANWD